MEVRVRVIRFWQGLKKGERRLVKKWAARSRDAVVRCRCKIIMSLVDGNIPTRIAESGLCSVSQIYRTARRFLEEGPRGLADKREDNGENKVDESYELELLRVVAGSPQDHSYLRPTWTQELLIRVLTEQTGITVSTTTMSRLLRRHRVRLGRPKPMVGCPWSKARKTRRLRQIKRALTNLGPDEAAAYLDEVDVDLNPKIGRDYMLRGQQKQVLTPGQNQKRYLAGALDVRTGKVTWVEGERKNSLLFLQLLHRLVTKTYPNAKRIHIVLDNFKIHDSYQVKLARAALGDRVVFHFLPPYCPDENRIERLWKDLHDNVTRNHRCHTMQDLMAQVRAYLRHRNRRGRGRHSYPRRRAA